MIEQLGRIGLVLAALLGAGGPLSGQGRDTSGTAGGRRRMSEMMQHMMPSSRMMAVGPETALAHADELGLSDAQRQRLRELAQATRDVLTADQRTKLDELRMKDMMRMMRMMSSMMGGDGMHNMGDMMGMMGDNYPTGHGSRSDSTRGDHH